MVSSKLDSGEQKKSKSDKELELTKKKLKILKTELKSQMETKAQLEAKVKESYEKISHMEMELTEEVRRFCKVKFCVLETERKDIFSRKYQLARQNIAT